MEIFHLLEFLGVRYTLDVEAMNQQYRKPLSGGQILLMGLDTSKTDLPDPTASRSLRQGG